MIFEPTNRDEVVIRMELYEARAFAETGLWQLSTPQGELNRADLQRAISETEMYSAHPKPGDRVTDPQGLLVPPEPTSEKWVSKILSRPERNRLEVLARGGYILKRPTAYLHGGFPNKNPDHYTYVLVSVGGTRRALGGPAKESVEKMLASRWLIRDGVDGMLVLGPIGRMILESTDRNGYSKDAENAPTSRE